MIEEKTSFSKEISGPIFLFPTDSDAASLEEEKALFPMVSESIESVANQSEKGDSSLNPIVGRDGAKKDETLLAVEVEGKPEIDEALLRFVKKERDEGGFYYSDSNEFVGLIDSVDSKTNTFIATYKNAQTSEEFVSEFDLNVFPNDENADSFVGKRFLLIIGSKRRYFFGKKKGIYSVTGQENFSKFSLIPNRVPVGDELQKIDETAANWASSFNI